MKRETKIDYYELKENTLEELKKFVESIPDKSFNQDYYSRIEGDCGCTLHHLNIAKPYLPFSLTFTGKLFNLDRRESFYLFGFTGNSIVEENILANSILLNIPAYNSTTKEDCLKRIDALLIKKIIRG